MFDKLLDILVVFYTYDYVYNFNYFLCFQMMSALQLCGASLDDYLHLLVPPIVKVMGASNQLEVRK